MRLVHFSGIPGRRARAAFLEDIFPKYIFIPLFIIFATICLLLAGCTDDEVIGPGNGGDDDPVCPLNTPWVEIVSPVAGNSPYYPPRIEFAWEQEPESMIAFTRYLLVELLPGDTGTEMLNEHPEQFDELWTEWKQWDPAGDSAVIGEEDPLENGIYFFAVQAMDSCGNVTDRFEHSTNTREFTVKTYPPVLVIWEPMLGSGTFTGEYMWPRPSAQVLPGIDFSFRWNAESTYSWFSPVQYRYGWDIENLDDDGEWTFPWSSQEKKSLPKTFASGVHVFFVEARDEAMTTTRARVEIEVIPYTADRDLLWIDDYPLGGYIPSMTDPSEEAHDAFWTDICSMVPGFDPATDILEALEVASEQPLPLSVLADYKNVVWTYSSSIRTTWQKTVEFVPVPIRDFPRTNSLRMFLAAGGNALTCGRADRPGGGFYETFALEPELPASVVSELFPSDYDHEFARHSMAYDDYYITVIDKVSGVFKSGEDMVPGINRNLDRDALLMAVEAGGGTDLDFPDTLMLDETVTCPACFFNPIYRGFTYVEAYDPAYYMDHIGATSHPCFTPIYWMRSRSTISPLYGAAIALRGTFGGGPGSCEPHRQTQHYSYHFGFPLWFMEHEKVEQIADEIFRSWDIK